jgi:hypothetical protein
MLRIFIYRSFWVAALFSVGMVCLVSALLVPTADRYFLAVLFLLATSFSLLLQATQPLILVLRRSVRNTIDVTLADVVLPFGCVYGRPIWLENPYDELVRGASARYSPYALECQLVSLVVLFFWLLPKVGVLSATCVSVLCLIGSTKLLDASVGNSAAGGAAFLAATAASGPLPSVFSPIREVASGTIAWVVVFAIVYGALRCLRNIRNASWSPIGNSVRRRWDLWWLRLELWLPLCFVTRYIHGGPAVVREVVCAEQPEGLWKGAVSELMRRSSHAIVDISELRPKSGLEWEIATCFANRIKVLAMCHESAFDAALANLRRAVPEATILPQDFRDIQKLKRVCEGRVPLVICCVYGDTGVADRIYPVLTVFFGGNAGLRTYLGALLRHK